MTDATRVGDVLVGEDYRALRESLVELIQAVGYPVRAAVDGVDGLAAVDARVPALILVDLQMPRMDGRTFIEIVQARDLPATVIALTSSSDDVCRIAEELHVDCLPKPVDPIRLVALLHASLN